jgi:putative ABC transport system permease protein
MIFENTRSAARALYVNKLRSSLTILGIIIGIGAVIVMVSVGSGAKKQLAEQIQGLGTNLIVVRSKSTSIQGVRAGAGTLATLTEEDATAIQNEITIVQAAACHNAATHQLVQGSLNWSTLVMAVTSEWLEVKEWLVTDGRRITLDDHNTAAKVVVLGHTVANHLFGDADPIGTTIRIGRVPFTVVGVLDVRGQTESGYDQDDVVMVPLSTARQKLFGRIPGQARAVWAITVRLWQVEDGPEAEGQIRDLLRQRHGLQPDDEDDFELRNPYAVVQTYEAASQTMAYFLAATASVSLLVGGIGIMNIMLVSVTERTREIGLRMAVGARRRDILTQFLIEAVTLSVIGGVIGIAVGLGGSHVLSYFAEWRTLIVGEIIVVAFGVAVAVGVLFGLYPARKAAHVDPIEALRYE